MGKEFITEHTDFKEDLRPYFEQHFDNKLETLKSQKNQLSKFNQEETICRFVPKKEIKFIIQNLLTKENGSMWLYY